MKHYFDSGIEWEMADEARSAGELAEPNIVEPDHDEDEDEDDEGDWQEENYKDAMFS